MVLGREGAEVGADLGEDDVRGADVDAIDAGEMQPHRLVQLRRQVQARLGLPAGLLRGGRKEFRRSP